MAYMRGNPYVYSDGDTLHVHAGQEGLTFTQTKELLVMLYDQTAEAIEQGTCPSEVVKGAGEYVNKSVEYAKTILDKSPPQPIADALALAIAGKFSQEELNSIRQDIAVEYGGNFGADAACRRVGAPTTMDYIKAAIKDDNAQT